MAAKKSAAPEGAIAAHVELKLGRKPVVHDFDDVQINTDDKEYLTVLLSDAEGHEMSVRLPRATVKKLLSWRLIMSL